MYRISKDIDLNEIVGSEIQQICSGRYDIQFHFHSGTNISVQGEISLLDRGQVLGTWNEEQNWTSLSFQQLLNVKVIQYSVPNDRLLQIDFANGFILQLHDSSDQYESFQIYTNDRNVITVI